MAALPPLGEGLPTAFPARSFAEVLTSKAPAPAALQSPRLAQSFDDAVVGSHKGFPSLAFEDAHIADLTKSFPWTLIGKFSFGYNKADPQKGRPSVANLEKYFQSLDLQSSFHLGLLDNRHLLIRLSSEADYLRLYSRTVWYVAKVTMRILKWSPYFNVDRETSLVPVWVSLPRLPVIFFAKSALFRIASLLGTPLRLDSATESLKRPGVARVQIEIDLLKERTHQIWIGMGSVTGFWQKIEYDHIPDYCKHCWHVGHSEALCTVHNPGLKALDRVVRPNTRMEYRPVVAQPKAPLPEVQSSPLDEPQNAQPNMQSAVVASAAKQLQQTLPQLTPTASVTPNEDFVSGTFPQKPLTVQQPDGISISVAPTNESAHLVGGSLHPVGGVVHVHSSVDEQLHGSVHPQCSKSTVAEEAPTDVLPQVSSQIAAPTSGIPSTTEQTSSEKTSIPIHHVDVPSSSVVCDDLHLGASAKMYSPDLLHMRSARHLPVPARTREDIYADLRSFAQPVPCKSDFRTCSQPPPVVVAGQSDGYNIAAVLPLAPTSISKLSHVQSSWHSPLAPDIGYNDSDYYQDTQGSDELGHDDYEDTDDHTYDDITDGSEGTHMQKKKDRRHLKGLASKPPVTIADFADQSRLINKRMSKRGRPPGSRNRTYFDMPRTMSTRATRATSD